MKSTETYQHHPEVLRILDHLKDLKVGDIRTFYIDEKRDYAVSTPPVVLQNQEGETVGFAVIRELTKGFRRTEGSYEVLYKLNQPIKRATLDELLMLRDMTFNIGDKS